jgi:hypothetical protein
MDMKKKKNYLKVFYNDKCYWANIPDAKNGFDTFKKENPDHEIDIYSHEDGELLTVRSRDIEIKK